MLQIGGCTGSSKIFAMAQILSEANRASCGLVFVLIAVKYVGSHKRATKDPGGSRPSSEQLLTPSGRRSARTHLCHLIDQLLEDTEGRHFSKGLNTVAVKN